MMNDLDVVLAAVDGNEDLLPDEKRRILSILFARELLGGHATNAADVFAVGRWIYDGEETGP